VVPAFDAQREGGRAQHACFALRVEARHRARLGVARPVPRGPSL